MKKVLYVMLIVLTAAASVKADDIGDARRRERDALRWGGGIPYPGGPLTPGGPNIHPRPPVPPPPGPSYSDMYGPGRTVRWQDMGSFRAQKFIVTDIRLSAMGQFVNELYLTAQDNHISIKEARVRLANGQVLDLPHLRGTISKGQQMRLRLDQWYSLRADEIILSIESPNLLGSRGTLAVQLGLAW